MVATFRNLALDIAEKLHTMRNPITELAALLYHTAVQVFWDHDGERGFMNSRAA